MIRDLPSWTDQERAHLRDDFFRQIEYEFGDGGWPFQLSRRRAQPVVRLHLGRADGGLRGAKDPKMINDALYGWNGKKEAPTGGPAESPFWRLPPARRPLDRGRTGLPDRHRVRAASSTMRRRCGTTASTCIASMAER